MLKSCITTSTLLSLFKTEEKIARDLAKEREKNQKLREKGKLYSQELLKQIQDNAQRRKRDHEIEDNRAVHVFECDRKW